MDIGQVGYGPTHWQHTNNGITTNDSTDSWHAGLALTPSLEIRMKF